MHVPAVEVVRSEHAALHRVIHDMADLAYHLSGHPGPAAYRALDLVLEVLESHVAGHMADEERSLYPIVAEQLGGPAATATMIEDHREIRRWVDRLADDRRHLEDAPAPQVERVRQALYALAALLDLHVRKEELIYLPALRRANVAVRTPTL
jgi:iron-sulfur cluster repair protein YtfE (RIC family)